MSRPTPTSSARPGRAAGVALALAVELADVTTRSIATRRGRYRTVDRFAPAHRPVEPVPDEVLS